jgi:hypothetical protein
LFAHTVYENPGQNVKGLSGEDNCLSGSDATETAGGVWFNGGHLRGE